MKKNNVRFGSERGVGMRGMFGAVAFTLEVLAWVALARWGWAQGSGTALGAVFAVLAALIFTAFWGAFLSPRAAVSLSLAAKVALQLIAFAVASWAAASVWGRPFAAAFFGIAALTFVSPLFHGGKSCDHPSASPSSA